MRNHFFTATARQSLLLLLLTGLAAVVTGWIHPRAPDYQPRTSAERSPLAITWQEVGALGTEVLWIDARPAPAYEARHVPGAILLNEDLWESGFEEVIFRWSPDQTVVVYCDAASCHASEAVARQLRHELGAGNIYFLEGGWAQWLEETAH